LPQRSVVHFGVSGSQQSAFRDLLTQPPVQTLQFSPQAALARLLSKSVETSDEEKQVQKLIAQGSCSLIQMRLKASVEMQVLKT
jgi:hypothetical protein